MKVKVQTLDGKAGTDIDLNDDVFGVDARADILHRVVAWQLEKRRGPARAARELGWVQVPLFDACEIPVPGSLPRCIRALLLWNTETPQDGIVHIYLREAQSLRPDLNNAPSPKETNQ